MTPDNAFESGRAEEPRAARRELKLGFLRVAGARRAREGRRRRCGAGHLVEGPAGTGRSGLVRVRGWANAREGGMMRTNMNAIKVDTTIDEAVARAIPALRPLLGKHVELIALEAAPAPAPERKLTVDELLASRIKLPPGVVPLSLEDMERAIAEGALGR